jgi:uncharacterized protein (DUF1330 family)
MTKVSPAYLMAHLKIKDHADYIERYVANVLPLLEKYRAQILVASSTAKVEEGDSSENWTVLLKFFNLTIAEEFYHSKEYEPLKWLRVDELTTGGTVVLVEGFEGMPSLQSDRSAC